MKIVSGTHKAVPGTQIDNNPTALQRPNMENILLGEQYLPNFISYLEFCRALAEKEDLKEYVSPSFDTIHYTEPEIKIPITKTKNSDKNGEKPEDSYALMIFKALDSAPDGKLTLSEIYSWIENAYPYYQKADPVWKNSIRHNLSLNPTFKKIPRPTNSKGKGGYWSIDQAQRHGKLLKSRRQKTEVGMLSVGGGKMVF